MVCFYLCCSIKSLTFIKQTLLYSFFFMWTVFTETKWGSYFLQCGRHVDPTPPPPRHFPVFARPWLARRPRPSKLGWAGLKQSTRVPFAVDGTPRQTKTRADSRAAAAASTQFTEGRACVSGIRTINRTSANPDYCLFPIISSLFPKASQSAGPCSPLQDTHLASLPG